MCANHWTAAERCCSSIREIMLLWFMYPNINGQIICPATDWRKISKTTPMLCKRKSWSRYFSFLCTSGHINYGHLQLFSKEEKIVLFFGYFCGNSVLVLNLWLTYTYRPVLLGGILAPSMVCYVLTGRRVGLVKSKNWYTTLIYPSSTSPHTLDYVPWAF